VEEWEEKKELNAGFPNIPIFQYSNSSNYV